MQPASRHRARAAGERYGVLLAGGEVILFDRLALAAAVGEDRPPPPAAA